MTLIIDYYTTNRLIFQENEIDNVNNDASNVYDDFEEYEPAFDEDNPFVEDSGKIVLQVSQEPKQNVPTLNNGNK